MSAEAEVLMRSRADVTSVETVLHEESLLSSLGPDEEEDDDDAGNHGERARRGRKGRHRRQRPREISRTE